VAQIEYCACSSHTSAGPPIWDTPRHERLTLYYSSRSAETRLQTQRTGRCLSIQYWAENALARVARLLSHTTCFKSTYPENFAYPAGRSACRSPGVMGMFALQVAAELRLSVTSLQSQDHITHKLVTIPPQIDGSARKPDAGINVPPWQKILMDIAPWPVMTQRQVGSAGSLSASDRYAERNLLSMSEVPDCQVYPRRLSPSACTRCASPASRASRPLQSCAIFSLGALVEPNKLAA
jgi:hypothetical protein